MSVDKTKVEQAFELLSQANSLIQSSGLTGEIDSQDGMDVVYVIHNVLENAIDEVRDALAEVGYYD